MKKLVFLTVVAFMVTSSYSQNLQLENAVKEALAMLDSGKTIIDMQSALNRFERIAMAEPGRWEPQYHYAYAQILTSFYNQKPEMKVKLLDQAEAGINQALELNGDKSELNALLGFLYQARLTADPGLAMTYSQKAAEVFGKALYENPENPRAMYLMVYSRRVWGRMCQCHAKVLGGQILI
jgi:tetratricopeptide (TPR) repeat protein